MMAMVARALFFWLVVKPFLLLVIGIAIKIAGAQLCKSGSRKPETVEIRSTWRWGLPRRVCR